MTEDDPVALYCALLSDLRPDRLDELTGLCADTIVFKDPFNETEDLDGYRKVLSKMFDDVESHSFRVIDRADGRERTYLRWVFEAKLRNSGRQLSAEGMTELALDDHGRIARHVDYWDVGRNFYERLPLLGAVVAWVRRRAAA